MFFCRDSFLIFFARCDVCSAIEQRVSYLPGWHPLLPAPGMRQRVYSQGFSSWFVLIFPIKMVIWKIFTSFSNTYLHKSPPKNWLRSLHPGRARALSCQRVTVRIALAQRRCGNCGCKVGIEFSSTKTLREASLDHSPLEKILQYGLKLCISLKAIKIHGVDGVDGVLSKAWFLPTDQSPISTTGSYTRKWCDFEPRKTELTFPHPHFCWCHLLGITEDHAKTIDDWGWAGFQQPSI